MAKSLNITSKDGEIMYPVTVSSLVYNRFTEESIEEELNNKLESSDIKTVNGVSLIGSGNITIPKGDNGEDAYQPFKGWFDTSTVLNTAHPSPLVGDYAYVKGTNAVSIYACTTAGTWVDSGREFNPANNQEFASGESLDVVNIVNNLESNSSTDVLSAQQGKILAQMVQNHSGGNADGFVDTNENGFYIIDQSGRIGMQYTNDGLDAAKLSLHFQSLLPSSDQNTTPVIVRKAGLDNEMEHLQYYTHVTLGLFSDIHGASVEMQHFVNFCKYYNLNYMLHLGDAVYQDYEDGVDFWSGIADSNKILNTIGNHDVRKVGNYQSYYSGTQGTYDRYIKPFIDANLPGVVQPSDAASTYKCYYYVDLKNGSTTTNIRMIVLDCTSWGNTDAGAAQYNWLNDLLTSSRNEGKHVLICSHYAANTIQKIEGPFNPSDSTITTDVSVGGRNRYLDTEITSSSDNANFATTPMKASALIQSHIDQGLIFIGWICGHRHISFIGHVKDGSTVYPQQLQIFITTNKDEASTPKPDNALFKVNFGVLGIKASTDAADGRYLKFYAVGRNTFGDGGSGKVKQYTYCYSYATHTMLKQRWD